MYPDYDGILLYPDYPDGIHTNRLQMSDQLSSFVTDLFSANEKLFVSDSRINSFQDSSRTETPCVTQVLLSSDVFT